MNLTIGAVEVVAHNMERPHVVLSTLSPCFGVASANALIGLIIALEADPRSCSMIVRAPFLTCLVQKLISISILFAKLLLLGNQKYRGFLPLAAP